MNAELAKRAKVVLFAGSAGSAFYVPASFSSVEYSTDPDRVTVEIVPIDGGCDVTLTHEMLQDYAPYVDATVRAYTEHLARLDAILLDAS